MIQRVGFNSMSYGMTEIQNLSQTTFFRILLYYLIFNFYRPIDQFLVWMVNIKVLKRLIIISIKNKGMLNHLRKARNQLPFLKRIQEFYVDKYSLRLSERSDDIFDGIHVNSRFPADGRIHLR